MSDVDLQDSVEVSRLDTFRGHFSTAADLRCLIAMGRPSQAALLTAAAATTLAAALVYCRHRQRKPKSVRFATEPLEAELQKAFETATAKVSSLKHLSNGDKLLLYALYKQTTIGDAPDNSKALTSPQQYAKRQAWWKLRNMKAQEAAARYVVAVDEMSSRTSEADDLDEDLIEDSLDTFGPTQSRPEQQEGSTDTDNSDPGYQVLVAAAKEDLNKIKEIVSTNDKLIHYKDPGTGECALHHAADKGHLRVVEYLLDQGAEVNACDNDGISVLQAAVIAGHLDICQLLLQEGANPDLPDSDGDSPRSCAADDGSRTLRKLFKEYPIVS